MDVISLEKTKENFRVLYDVKGRFILRKIKSDEAKFKLCKIKAKETGTNKVPYVVTHDGRTLRYPDPKINVGDTIKLELVGSKILEVIPQEIGNTYYFYISFLSGVIYDSRIHRLPRQWKQYRTYRLNHQY